MRNLLKSLHVRQPDGQGWNKGQQAQHDEAASKNSGISRVSAVMETRVATGMAVTGARMP
ncbi:hypothetical protein [Comamonas sp. lk]|uniref:hypothetical protein n=1 Tax=Comamonas sp. lk TaxID=2201272 RepID=UPI0013CE9557|nr:hypothetical protein [Comamonas sp. lk]